MSRLTNIFSLTGHGVRDWFLQRVSASLIAAYVFFLLSFCLIHYPVNFVTWHVLFQMVWVRIFTILFLLSLFVHAWIGMWVIVTDYIKPFALRLIIQTLINLSLLSYFIWGVMMLWRN